MGMTIEEIIERLYDIQTDAVYQITTEEKESITEAVDTMRKYQKIEQVMDELNGNFYGSYLKDRQALEKIYEVVEDGSN